MDRIPAYNSSALVLVFLGWVGTWLRRNSKQPKIRISPKEVKNCTLKAQKLPKIAQDIGTCLVCPEEKAGILWWWAVNTFPSFGAVCAI